MGRDYSDLETVRDETQGLEVDVSRQQKSGIRELEGHKIWAGHQAHWKSDVDIFQERSGTKQDVRRQRWWLRPSSKAFKVILAIFAVLLVLGAIGGGVGGALASRAKGNKADDEPVASGDELNATSDGIAQTEVGIPNTTSSAFPTATETTNPITVSTIALPTATFIRDCPSSNNTLYNVTTGDGEPIIFRKMCGKEFMGPWQSYSESVVTVNRAAKSLDECITMCVSANTASRAAIGSKEKLACNAVCWRNGGPGDPWPHNCFAGQTFNASGTFAAYDEVLCDSATWINQGDRMLRDSNGNSLKIFHSAFELENH